jgi:hypothetical protein
MAIPSTPAEAATTSEFEKVPKDQSLPAALLRTSASSKRPENNKESFRKSFGVKDPPPAPAASPETTAP